MQEDILQTLLQQPQSDEKQDHSQANAMGRETLYNFAFIDEDSKREVRRQLLKAVAIPGHLVPFASRDLPIARGWGTGGLQVTMVLVEPQDIVKVIDQGDDDSVNAVNLRRLIQKTTGIEFTTDTVQASIIQTRHRIPEEALRDDQILVFQVPMADSLRWVEPVLEHSAQMHAEADYGRMWVFMYESVVRAGDVEISSQYPVMVEDRYIMDTSPIPRYDVPRLHMAETLYLFGAGREKRVYAVPPYTRVVPLQFEDYPFKTEHDPSQSCERCGTHNTFLTRSFVEPKKPEEAGRWMLTCSDTSYCDKRLRQQSSHETSEVSL
ncbi:phosphonate metabolism PhnJ [Ktedonobacter racemifer DSM 44963]|uniref:Phosphonate metabolism PhnJ n=2 Tax=Ktedonobacter racemifer TaxID=363277 RepID=D6TK48_KTERA|nr:alpha-D-ribose 1-methylphosphonate 5-phosphate C-P-lyase PhnJ [Ktedonobacter racemifer]EFH89805.1 phosphonate metabolism PhnJ [Ktedonobacter racemifer DSM 44963]